MLGRSLFAFALSGAPLEIGYVATLAPLVAAIVTHRQSGESGRAFRFSSSFGRTLLGSAVSVGLTLVAFVALPAVLLSEDPLARFFVQLVLLVAIQGSFGAPIGNSRAIRTFLTGQVLGGPSRLIARPSGKAAILVSGAITEPWQRRCPGSGVV